MGARRASSRSSGNYFHTHTVCGWQVTHLPRCNHCDALVQHVEGRTALTVNGMLALRVLQRGGWMEGGWDSHVNYLPRRFTWHLLVTVSAVLNTHSHAWPSAHRHKRKPSVSGHARFVDALHSLIDVYRDDWQKGSRAEPCVVRTTHAIVRC
jgi:hypothetical protein